jgi:hypothetical protein
MPTFSARDYADILRELEEFETYLQGMCVPAARVASAIAGIREIQAAREEGRLRELNMHPQVDELIWSLVEGQEFTRIFRGLRGYDERAIRGLLKRALRGPRRVIWETATTNVARNTIFELVLGAGLRQAGASIELGKDADLILSHEGARFYIECKRPLFEGTVRKNAVSAARQLRSRFDGDPQSGSVGGLIAISISKALNPGSKWFQVETEADLQSLTLDVRRIYAQVKDYLDRQIDVRLAGILFHVFTPAYVRRTGILTVASQCEIFLSPDRMASVFPFTGEGIKNLLRRAMGPG